MSIAARPLPAFTLKQLAYLVAAADSGTIAGAATRLNVSPSALSDAITELETAIQEQLCVRRRAHGLTLTPSGDRVVAHARRMLAEADELARAVGGTDTLSGPIVIGCYPTLAPTVLPRLLREFGAEHPHVDLTIREATQCQLADDIAAGRVDVAFVYDMLVPPETERVQLAAFPAHVVLTADHPLADRDTVRLADLVDDDLILLDAPPSSEHTLSVFAAQGLTPRVRHRTSSYEVVRTLVARGLGYGILVSRVSNPRSYEGLPLVAKPIEPPVRPVAIDMIWAPNRPVPARTRAFIGFARGLDWGA